MMIRFRVLSDENDYFLREYEVADDMSLLDLNAFICKNLGVAGGEMTEFFTSDREWSKILEFTPFDIGDEDTAAMGDTVVGTVAGKLGDRLIFVFDSLTDRALFMEVVAVGDAAPGVSYPRAVRAESSLEEGEARSIFDEVMSDFGDFEEDGGYDDE